MSDLETHFSCRKCGFFLHWGSCTVKQNSNNNVPGLTGPGTAGCLLSSRRFELGPAASTVSSSLEEKRRNTVALWLYSSCRRVKYGHMHRQYVSCAGSLLTVGRDRPQGSSRCLHKLKTSPQGCCVGFLVRGDVSYDRSCGLEISLGI